MRKIIVVASFLGLMFVCGCKVGEHRQFQRIDTETNTTQNVGHGFSDERYIWETWFFSTNKVESVK